ncbi:MAG: hypothetical protein KAF27_04110 [Porphyrobacter sp.]|nr:hypothetical protein [Porphyrobacter sp.]
MQLAAWVVLLLAASWLVWIGGIMAFRPLRALELLGKTATSALINAIEQVPRLMAGGAMMVRAEVSRFPEFFWVAGLFIVASSAALLVIPLRWHNGYAVFWARRIPPVGVRMIAPISVLGGIGLIWAA